MSSKNRRQQMRVAKQRRQKQIAIGGAVLLAVLLAIQAPRLLHGGGSSAAATTAAETTAGATTPGETTPTSTVAGSASAAPTGSTTAGAPTATGAPTTHTRLPDSDVVPLRLRTQLASFELFDSKDPFVQQVSDQPPPTAAVPAPTAPAPGAAAGSGTAPATPTAPATVIASTTQSQGTARTLAHNSGAVIEVNGKSERVGVDQAFPSSSPTFKLVSLANDVAMIGIAGGAYASGAQTVALQAGKTLTLVNTSDGVRYELRLVSTS
ncbi:MAG TPA: hypothetical protein VFI01_08235 [Gaiellaceae bacterium]|nr:hypothetical protein [Gaiellaceae bacterium]